MAHLTHMTNTLNAFTGIDDSSNTSAKLNNARPLLVVHSGNTTMGRSASLRILLRGLASPARPLNGGTAPVKRRIVRRETVRKPWIGMRTDGGRDPVEIVAEPVPVRRPGVLDLDVSTREESFSIGAGIGRTKIGSNLQEK